MPIRLRLALLFAAATLVATGIGGVLFVRELSAGLRNSTLATLEVRAGAISQQLPDPGGQGGGSNTAGTGIQDPGSPPSIAGAVDAQELTQVIGPRGRIVDAAGPGTDVSLLTAAQLHQAVHQSIVVQRGITGQSDPFLLLAAPFGTGSVLVVGVSLATVNQAVHRVVLEIIVGGTIGVVAAGLGAWLLAGAALRPVERMRREAAELSEHDTDAILAIPRSRDEIAALAETLNGLLGRLHAALDRQRGFVSAAGHELRSPLAILKSELELGSRPGRSPAEQSAALASAASETDRIIHLTDDLLVLSRSDEQALALQRSPTDLAELATTAVDAFRPRALVAAVSLAVDAPVGLVVEVDPVRYRQIIDNLIDNALRYAPAQSTVRIAVERVTGGASLEVGDEGPGFPEEFLPRAFQRFSRPDASRNRDSGGSGLGLAIVKSLAEAHGGTAAASNRPTGGAVVTVVIPSGTVSDPEGGEGRRHGTAETRAF